MRTDYLGTGIFTLLAGAGLLMVTHAAQAAEERRIMENQIHELLANTKVTGKGFEQTFGDPRGHDSASTTYWESSNASYGRWRVTADKYCSQWGNPDYWSCYQVYLSEDAGESRIIWVDVSGRRFEGVLAR